MNQDKYVFAQLVEFLNNDKFRRLVDKYDGNRYVKNDRLTSWIFQEGSMRLIPLRFLYVWLHSLGRSSVRKKVELRLMSFMT